MNGGDCRTAPATPGLLNIKCRELDNLRLWFVFFPLCLKWCFVLYRLDLNCTCSLEPYSIETRRDSLVDNRPFTNKFKNFVQRKKKCIYIWMLILILEIWKFQVPTSDSLGVKVF